MIASKKSIAKARQRKIKASKPKSKRFVPPKKYTSFNIFSKYGENHLDVKTPYAMTLEEAMDFFNCLAISGNE